MIAAGPVVISGIGTISAAGWSVESLVEALAAGGARTSEVDRSAGFHHDSSSRTAFLVDDAGLGEWIAPMAARRMCRPSRLAVAAARMAVASSRLDSRSFVRASVIGATSYGPSLVTEKLIRQILLEGPQVASPALFTESVSNAPTAQIALALGAKGTNTTVTQRQAGPLLALRWGMMEVATGRAPVALVGAVEPPSRRLRCGRGLHRSGPRARRGGTETRRDHSGQVALARPRL
jgi:3-oxoacyl-[acyl-carrier-protein] synthase II